jgi:hypothetical protein
LQRFKIAAKKTLKKRLQRWPSTSIRFFICSSRKKSSLLSAREPWGDHRLSDPKKAI